MGCNWSRSHDATGTAILIVNDELLRVEATTATKKKTARLFSDLQVKQIQHSAVWLCALPLMKLINEWC